jgi:hypothetical protein
VWIIIAPDQSY